MCEEKKETIVVAREGYQVLLNVGARNFLINCHEPINLSEYFPDDVLAICASLRANLEDGNLVPFVGQDLTQDNANSKIKLMREVSGTTKIEAGYNQKEETSSLHMHMKTTTKDITSDVKKNIQTRVAKSRDQIREQDNKILTKNKEKSVGNSQPKERRNPMTKEELTMDIQMDVSPAAFAEKQKNQRKKLRADETADNERVTREIKEIEAREDSAQQESETNKNS